MSNSRSLRSIDPPNQKTPQENDCQSSLFHRRGTGSIDALTSYGNVRSEQYAWRHKADSPYEIYTIPWQDSDYLDVTIEAFHGSDRLTSSVVNDIPIRRNCITTCRGQLFNGKVGKVSFTISVDDTWGTPIDYEIPKLAR